MKLLAPTATIFTLLSLLISLPVATGQQAKPRVIVMTDGEVDDRSSMVRFLLYICDMDVEAIIETNSIYQKNGHSDEPWLEHQLDAYEAVYPNLTKHRDDYPTPDYLRSICYVGDEDINHIEGLNLSLLKPGDEVRFTPDDWPDTPGSDRIVEVLLEDDPANVYIQAWGGGNTAARAFYKLKRQYPSDYERAMRKVVMYNIWYQDGAGNYIERNHPLATMLYCDSFSGSWDYRSQNDTYSFVTEHVKNDHGPLGALYPQDYISEGDSPSFFYTIANGLQNYMDPNWGGWGGRFVRFEGLPNVYIDAMENGDQWASMRRWIEDVNNDFQARMDWCVAEEFEHANHPPVPVIDNWRMTAKSGEFVTIDASKSYDPEKTYPKRVWSYYREAGSYDGDIRLIHTRTPRASFVAPEVDKPETVHIILSLIDYNADPVIRSYARVIVTVEP